MFALLSCKNKTKCLKINLLLYFEESFVDSYKIDSRDVSLVLPVRTITVSSNTGSPRVGKKCLKNPFINLKNIIN